MPRCRERYREGDGQALLVEGARVVAVSHRPDELEAAAAELSALGSITGEVCDVSDEAVADTVFLLTPRDVELSAEDRARHPEGEFFNQA
ncbi:MAG: hypothetical protein ABI927_07985 [Gaiellaceae bacterium]